MAVRQIYKSGLSLVRKNGVGPIFGNNNTIIRLLTSFINCDTFSSNSSSLYRDSRKYIGINFTSNSYGIDKRMVSTKQQPKSYHEVSTVNMGSILEHHKYKEMKSKLSKRNRKSLGPLDTASLYILSSKDLNANLEILRLDALSPESHLQPGCKGYAEIQEMKQRGAVKKGKLNKEDETAIEKRFETLLAETGLDKEALMEELFAANKGRRYNWDKEKEQLIVKAYYAIKQQ